MDRTGCDRALPQAPLFVVYVLAARYAAATRSGNADELARLDEWAAALTDPKAAAASLAAISRTFSVGISRLRKAASS